MILALENWLLIQHSNNNIFIFERGKKFDLLCFAMKKNNKNFDEVFGFRKKNHEYSNKKLRRNYRKLGERCSRHILASSFTGTLFFVFIPLTQTNLLKSIRFLNKPLISDLRNG